MTTGPSASDTVWGEWLSLYLTSCRRELDARELTELANAIESATTGTLGIELDSRVGERIARVARPLVDFMALAQDAETRAGLARQAVLRLRSAAATD